jgi:WD40 repeat protein
LTFVSLCTVLFWMGQGRDLALAQIEPVLTLNAHTYGINALAVVPNTSKLISGTGRYAGFKTKDKLCIGDLILWDLNEKKELNSSLGLDGVISCLECSKDGAFVIAGTAYGVLGLWDLKTFKLVGEWKSVHSDFIASLAFNTNTKTFYSAGLDKKLSFGNATAKQQPSIIWVSKHALLKAVISPNEQALVSIGQDLNSQKPSEFVVWDCAKNVRLREKSIEPRVSAVAFWNDAQCLVGDEKGGVSLVNVNTLESVKVFQFEANKIVKEVRGCS